MKKLALLAALIPAASFGQWSLPTILSDAPGQQNQAKVRTTLDGYVYISWFDFNGGINVRIQRFDKNGVKQFGEEGLLVADTALSSSQDYDLSVDNGGNAYITFLDDRFGTTNTATVSKITPAGSVAWQQNISGSTVASQPKVCVLKDNTVVAAYTASNTITMKRYTDSGIALGGMTYNEPSRYIQLADLAPADTNEVVAMWLRGATTSFMSLKQLQAQKFKVSTTQAVWPTPTVLYNHANGLSTAYFPTIVSDTNGGFVTSWYDGSNGLRAGYIEHVRSDGSLKFGQVDTSGAVSNLSIVEAQPTGRGYFGISVAYDPWYGHYIVAAREALRSTQNQDTVILQKIDRNGNRLWPVGGTKNGIQVQPLGSPQPSFVSAELCGEGGFAAYFQNNGALPQSIKAAAVDGDGNEVYGVSDQVEVYGEETTKGRLATRRDLSGDILMAWSDADDMVATRFSHPDGIGKTISGVITPGDWVTAPMFINWVITISDGDETESKTINVDNTGSFTLQTKFSGPVTVTIDGSHWLRRTFNNVGITVGVLTMQNGDADGSGEVDPIDIDKVVSAFGTQRFAPDYDPNTDLNGSNEVDPIDIDIVVANFGAQNEP